MSQFPNSLFSTPIAYTIGLGGLTAGSSVLGSTVINNADNNTTKFDSIWIEITLTSINPSASTPIIEGQLIPSFDGTNYISVGGSVFPPAGRASPYDFCYIDQGASAKRASLLFVNCQPVRYRLLIRNSTGIGFAASGHTVTWAGNLRETR
jgi:hypothetical protein